MVLAGRPVVERIRNDLRACTWGGSHHRIVGREADTIGPRPSQRELRELVRYRRSLIEELSREANRIQKMLRGANEGLAKRRF